jgi:hypothetical protein
VYSVCYCDEQEDETLETLGDQAATYMLSDDEKCASAAALNRENITGITVLGTDLDEHACGAKCSLGCIGPHCYCEGHTAGAAASVLCLPKTACKEACDLVGDDCIGINVHYDLPQCELIGSSCDASTQEAWQFFAKTPGTACTQEDDFREKVGTMTITSRVHTGVEYVITPGEAASIELTNPEGASFTYGPYSLLSRDRITIIDCGGTCGISPPTAGLLKPAGSERMATWNALGPHSHFQDLAHADTKNEPHDSKMKWGTRSSHDIRVYTKQDRLFVPGNNLMLADYSVAMDGDVRPLIEHQCYQKCSVECTDEWCYCSGYLHGYDDAASNAICGNQALCEWLCDAVTDCGSVDMHRSLDRCFLNLKDTADEKGKTHQDSLATDDKYMVLTPREDGNAEFAHHSPDEGSLPTYLLDPVDHGFSFDRMLRFSDITFKSGGTYKLCFCDASLLAHGQCRSEEDYSVDVGTIHASGVSCLIKKEELQRVSCAEQAHGGLRCYNNMPAPTPIHPLLPFPARPDSVTASTPPTLSCLYGTEEDGCATDPEADSTVDAGDGDEVDDSAR